MASEDRTELRPDSPDGRHRKQRSPALIIGLATVGAGVVASLYMGVTAVSERLADSRYKPVKWVDLESASDTGGARAVIQAEPPLRVAIAPVISHELSTDSYRELVAYLARALGRRPVLLQRPTYAEVNDLVRYQRCDTAFVCTYAYIRGEDDFGMQTLVVPVVAGEIRYHSYVIVPKTSSARSLLDLRGMRFASADMMSNTGWLYPALWLIDCGEDPARFFGEHVIAGSHYRSVTAVVSGFVDGAAVDSLVYDYMAREEEQVGERTRVIDKSPGFGIPPFVVHPAIDRSLKDRLRRAMIEMEQDSDGKRILSNLGIDRFVMPPADLYDGVRKAVAAWEER